MYRRKPILGRVISRSVNKLSRAFTGVRENVVDVTEDTEVLSTSCGNVSIEIEEIVKETSAIPAISVDNVDLRENQIDLRNLPTLLLSCGMNVDGDSSYILQLDQAVFLRNLNSHLYSSSRRKLLENMEEFMTNVKRYCADNAKFLKALLPTTTSAECHIARGSTQDCLIRLLLQIDEIQTDLTNFLLDRLAELALQEEIDFESDILPITWVKLILQPFRYLNFIVNSRNLCERLFDIIFSSADKLIQQEIIICLPDIIGDMDHYTAAIELSKLLKNELKLMPSILDALTNLSLQREIREEVRRNLIDTLKLSPIEYLPNIVKFLLCTGDSDSFDEILNGFRRELFANDSICFTNIMNEDNVDVEGVKILVFNNIRNCLLASKQLTDAWTKNISNLNREMKCRPLDLMVTVLLYDICTENTKKRSIETLFRSRIKNNLFHIQLIDEAFQYFRSPIIEFFNSFMSILSKLLKSVDRCVINFITAFYIALFQHTDQQLSRTIIKELLAYVGAGDANDAQTALRILLAMVENFRLKMLPLSSMLRVLLDKFTDMPLKDVQLLLDVLCSLAFIEVDDNGDTMLLKTEVITSIETQVSSPNIKVSRVGIIGAVMAISHITRVADEETNLSPNRCSEDFDEHVLSEKAKRGLPFLRLLIDGTRIIPESQGFAFDQLSLILKKRKNMDKTFLYYMSIMMKENMKKYFLICNDEVKLIDFVDCALKFGLNEDEEFVALNLTPILVEERNNSCAGLRMCVLVLPSLLRLIKELECEDLREIDGLLECPVVVPAPSALDEFSIQSPEVQVVIMDSLFYLTNWFREIVNCFARFIKLPSGKKVLIRLRTIIWLQKLISKYLPQMLTKDYCPPKCHFHTDIRPCIGSGKKKRKTLNKKRKNDSKTSDIRKHLVRTDSAQQSVLEDSDNEDSKDEMMANMKDYKQFLRELDWDIWIMLNLPLTLEPELANDWQLKPEFGPSELLFVLEDLVEKLKFVLKSAVKDIPFKNSMNTDVALTSIYNLYDDVPELFVKNITKLTPRLCTHLESLAQFCQTLLKKSDNIFDATDMFTPLSAEIKCSYSLIIKAFFTMFNWSGFDEDNNQDLFVAALLKISSRFEFSAKSTSTLALIRNSVSYFVQFQKTVLHLECGMNLVALIEVLNKRAEKCKEICKILGSTCWSFLSQHWYDWKGVQEKGAVFNKNIEYLLTTYFSCVNSKLRAIQQMCGWILEEVTNLNNKDSSLTTLPNINKSNCNILLRVILKTLVMAAKEGIDTQSECIEQLELWAKVFCIMESIVAILKSQSVRANLICFVRGSAPILRLFLNHGIAACSSLFRNESLQVVHILKSSQVMTRYLQKIFDNTKLTEDSALCAYLPSIRSLLESLLLRVKEIIIMNGCSEAFFVGSMRNKDIRGQDILSQSTVDQDSEKMDVVSDETNNDGGSIEIEEDPTEDNDENEDADDVDITSEDTMKDEGENDDEPGNKRKRRK